MKLSDAASTLAAAKPRETYRCDWCGEIFWAQRITGEKTPRYCPRPRNCRQLAWQQRNLKKILAQRKKIRAKKARD